MATLINVATPGPALSDAGTSGTAFPLVGDANSDFFASVTAITQSTWYNLNSLSLGAGVWLVLGLSTGGAPGQTLNFTLSLTSAASTSSWPILGATAISASASPLLNIAAVIRLTTTTTVYLNGQCTTNSTQVFKAGIAAVQIA